MIDATQIDRELMDRLLEIAKRKVADAPEPGTGDPYLTEVEKTCALLNELAVFFLEELDKDLKAREVTAARRRDKPAPPRPPDFPIF